MRLSDAPEISAMLSSDKRPNKAAEPRDSDPEKGQVAGACDHGCYVGAEPRRAPAVIVTHL